MVGKCSLCIYGECLNFDLLTQEMRLSPTKIIHKGENVTANRRASKDLWSYGKEITENADFNFVFKNFIQELQDKKIYLKEINTNDKEIVINCYLSSDKAQMGFSLDIDTMCLLNQLEIQVDFHILSYGMI